MPVSAQIAPVAANIIQNGINLPAKIMIKEKSISTSGKSLLQPKIEFTKQNENLLNYQKDINKIKQLTEFNSFFNHPKEQKFSKEIQTVSISQKFIDLDDESNFELLAGKNQIQIENLKKEMNFLSQKIDKIERKNSKLKLEINKVNLISEKNIKIAEEEKVKAEKTANVYNFEKSRFENESLLAKEKTAKIEKEKNFIEAKIEFIQRVLFDKQQLDILNDLNSFK